MSKLWKTVFAALLLLASFVSTTPKLSAQEVHGVVDTTEGCLMGGIAGGRWLDADEVSVMLKGGERYRLYNLTKALGEAAGSDAASAGEPCNGTKTLKLTPETRGAIAVGGSWNALPRVSRSLSVNDPAYRQVVMKHLLRRGFTRPKINITQILRIDLDGDGMEEVLLSATHLAGGMSVDGGRMAVHGKPGDYSFVLLRRIIKGKVRDELLTEHFYPRKTELPETPMQYKVAAVLDLNNDGKMEVIIHGGYYEGSWSTVYRLIGNKTENVFGCGCGA
jgi:hypothetical protein